MPRSGGDPIPRLKFWKKKPKEHKIEGKEQWYRNDLVEHYDEILKTGMTYKELQKRFVWCDIPSRFWADCINLVHLHREEILKLRGEEDADNSKV